MTMKACHQSLSRAAFVQRDACTRSRLWTLCPPATCISAPSSTAYADRKRRRAARPRMLFLPRPCLRRIRAHDLPGSQLDLPLLVSVRAIALSRLISIADSLFHPSSPSGSSFELLRLLLSYLWEVPDYRFGTTEWVVGRCFVVMALREIVAGEFIGVEPSDCSIPHLSLSFGRSPL